MNASKSALDALVDQVVVLQTKTNDLSTSAKNCGLVPGDCPPTSGARDQLATLTAFMTTLVATFRNVSPRFPWLCYEYYPNTSSNLQLLSNAVGLWT